MKISVLTCLKTFLNFCLISPGFCTPNTDGVTQTNYNETCDIIKNGKAYCPSEQSAIGRKVYFEKFPHKAKVICYAYDAINYLMYLPDMSGMNDIKELKIENCTGFQELTTIFKMLQIVTLTSLTISNDFGVKLTVAHLRDVDNLTTLQITESNLKALEPDCFRNLRAITLLYLEHNKLTHLPANLFNGTKALKQLNLEHNQLQNLPENIFKNLHFLQVLCLNDNKLAALPDEIFQGTGALLRLMLNNNQLTAINEKLFSTLKKMYLLDLSGNRLLSVHYNAFSNMARLSDLELHHNRLKLQQSNVAFLFPPKLQRLRLDGNAITGFNASWCLAYPSLTYINVSFNHITSIQVNDLITLINRDITINLSYNLIREINFPQKNYNRSQISDERLQNKRHFQAIYLAHNPWRCECHSTNMLRFVQMATKLIEDLDELRCNDTRFIKGMSVLETIDICPPDQTFTITLITMAYFSALVAILLGCYYKYHQEITIWLYAHNMCLPCITETELDRGKIYDAFISYSSKDHQFIADHLQPQLEHGPQTFRLCIHVRDWLVGEVIADQIMRSVEQSRRTIIVLSQNFIASSWSLMEFRAAHQAALCEGRVRVIIIMYGEIDDMEHLDPLLKSYLKMHTYLEWGDPWFWAKLRYAMPHTRRRSADVRRNFEDIELDRFRVQE